MTGDGAMSYEARIRELGLELPGPHLPHPPLVGALVWAGRARTSGQLPRAGGELVCTGRLGEDVSEADGREAARLCALNALSVLRHELGSLDAIERVLCVLGFIASAPGFRRQPQVLNGASDVLAEIFGAAGAHTRSAVGVAALPHGGPVEIELEVALRPGWT